jgi:hypothetical protein
MRMLKKGVTANACITWQELTPPAMFKANNLGRLMGDAISSYVADFFMGVDPDYTRSSSEPIVSSWADAPITGDAICLHLRLVHEDISNNGTISYILQLVINGNTHSLDISFSTNYDQFLYFPVPTEGTYAVINLIKKS